MGRYTPVEEKYYEEQKRLRLGETNTTHQGHVIKIVEYNGATNVIVEFEDGVRKKVEYKNFKLGTVRYPGSKLVRTKPLEEERKNMRVINKWGDEMFIAQYNSSQDIIVEFNDDYHGQVHTEYKCFKRGTVENPYHPGKYGEITGNKYPTKINNKKVKEYNTWRGILQRVFEPETHENTRTYVNIKLDPDWLYYPNFYEWIHSQSNYIKWKNNEGGRWDIDKDILSDPFNKIYSSETCSLIPHYINAIIARNFSKDKQDGLPEGVYLRNGKYYYFDKKRIFCETAEDAKDKYRKNRLDKLKSIAEEAYLNKDITETCYKGLLKYNYFID